MCALVLSLPVGWGLEVYSDVGALTPLLHIYRAIYLHIYLAMDSNRFQVGNDNPVGLTATEGLEDHAEPLLGSEWADCFVASYN